MALANNGIINLIAITPSPHPFKTTEVVRSWDSILSIESIRHSELGREFVELLYREALEREPVEGQFLISESRRNRCPTREAFGLTSFPSKAFC